nr:hypothetical protein [uncultured Mediterranean phage uvMED]
MNNNSWQLSLHEDKNISFCVASLLTGHYEHNVPVNDRLIDALTCVHNLNKRQVKTAIKTALNYIKNNKKG